MTPSNPPPTFPGIASTPMVMAGPVVSVNKVGCDVESDEEMLEMGDAEELALGEADEDWFEDEAGFSLTFGDADDDGTEDWQVGDLKELVVQETTGKHGPDGSDGRNDAIVMESVFDEDADMVAALWSNRKGGFTLERRPRTSAGAKEWMPYGMIAVLLLVLGAIVSLAIIVVVLTAWVATSEPDAAVVVHVEPEGPTKLEESQKKTADQILEELLEKEAAEQR